MSIGKKILIGFIIVVTIGVMMGVIGLVFTRVLTKSTADLQSQNEFSSILIAHFNWRNGLTQTVMTGSDFKGSLDPKTCALGKWLSSDEAKKVTDPKIKALLDQIIIPHENIHHGAEPVVNKMKAGDADGAQNEMLHVVFPQLEIVIDGLTKLKSEYDELAKSKVSDMEHLGNSISFTIAVIIIVSFIFAVGLSIVIIRSIVNPIMVAIEGLSES
jgi:methyl-accepting chemotaxis protein